jgi:hypothetical protein
MLDPIYVASLLVYVFILGKILRKSNCYFLYFCRKSWDSVLAAVFLWFVEGLLSYFFYGVVSVLMLVFSLYYPLKGWIVDDIVSIWFYHGIVGFSIYGN